MLMLRSRGRVRKRARRVTLACAWGEGCERRREGTSMPWVVRWRRERA
jgi:hypothetical protein